MQALSAEQWELLGRDPLLALPFAEAKAVDDVPDDVLAAWQRTIASYRRLADQAEMSLLSRMRQQGKSWEDVSDLLGLADGTAAERYHKQLEGRLKQRPFAAPHPSGDAVL